MNNPSVGLRAVLSAVHERVGREWVKGANARTREGKEVPYNDPNAWSFCLLGAVSHVLNHTLGGVSDHAYKIVLAGLGDTLRLHDPYGDIGWDHNRSDAWNLMRFNDTRTNKEDVRQLVVLTHGRTPVNTRLTLHPEPVLVEHITHPDGWSIKE